MLHSCTTTTHFLGFTSPTRNSANKPQQTGQAAAATAKRAFPPYTKSMITIVATRSRLNNIDNNQLMRPSRESDVSTRERSARYAKHESARRHTTTTALDDPHRTTASMRFRSHTDRTTHHRSAIVHARRHSQLSGFPAGRGSVIE